MLEIPDNVYSALHLAVVRFLNISDSYHLRVFSAMRDAGIGVQLHYSPVHLQPFYRDLGFLPGSYPHAELYSKNAMSLPLYPGLSDDDQDHVINTFANII